MKLPGDELGRSWVAAEFDGIPRNEETVLLTLIGSNAEETCVVGNAFVVLDQGNFALCLTAAHNFEKIKRLQQSQKLASHPTLPRVFRPAFEFIDPAGMTALYRFEGEFIFCKVANMNYIEHHDAALFTAHAPDHRPIFKTKIAIDLGVPAVGEEVAVLGHRLEAEYPTPHECRMSREVIMRIGVVTEVQMGQARQGQMFAFHTTIPVEPGLSGAPIIKKPQHGGAAVAFGIVSADISATDAFQSMLIAGDSTAAMLWPAMGLGLNAKLPDGTRGFTFLSNLLEPGLIDNRSNGVSVSAQHVNDRTEVTYFDTRKQQPVLVKLDSMVHPLKDLLEQMNQ